MATTAPTTRGLVLPAPGEVHKIDYRKSDAVAKQTQRVKERGDALSVVQWNIERGYQLPKIIEELKTIDADIIGIQEVDMHCERSGTVDTGAEIAKALEMNYIFISEFDEIHHPSRKPTDQGGGIHGNAILTKFDIGKVRTLSHYAAYHWERDGHLVNEPRKGERFILAIEILTPLGSVYCYCLHLEVFCGILDRIRQMADCFEDIRSLEREYKERGLEPPPIVICGDLNTMAHSIARLSKKYCRDKMRFWSLGMNEASWWKQHLFDVTEKSLKEAGEPLQNHYLKRWGFTDEEARRAVNPGLYDPFNIYHDVTLRNHWGLFQGKLDWVLLKHLICVKKSIGNHDYSASDHKWLRVELVVDRDDSKQKWEVGGVMEFWTFYFMLFSLLLLLLYPKLALY